MSTHDADPPGQPPSPENLPHKQESPISRLARIITQAARFKGDAHGLDNGEHAALARLDPDAEFRPHQIAALSRALVYADLAPENWQADTWRRWAMIAHGMALAGHDGSRRLGQQLSAAGVSESRVTKLLTARGDAFRQLVPRLLRLLASKEGQSPNWFELGDLILNQGRDEQAAEAIRLRIAGNFFSAEAKKPKH
ncbi:MAG: type I-E CRISPR-associated protein Cse2/CasB [Candidatus Accumulibacter propinquus]|jgi:CRISPR system Cascade subunit CasB